MNIKIQLAYNSVVRVNSNTSKHVYEQTIVPAEMLEDVHAQLNKTLHMPLPREVQQE